MDEKGKFVLRPIGRILDEDEPGDDEDLYRFWFQKQVFTSERHCSVLRPCTTIAQTWRMKERMKTVSVALVLCLNIGVDPPDTVKISPCARQQCWIGLLDVNGGNVQKPIEIIGAALQKQYERWQPKARYKLSLDPTTDDIKKLCQSLRRNAKDERVLFHYNGHGVPKPTSNGEIWVFNKHYTQYIPLSVCDLQIWMGSPSIYVFDCSNAGNVVEYLNNPHVGGTYKEFDFANEVTYFLCIYYPAFISVPPSISSPYSYILLAACQASEILPLCQHLPADLFTSCLTTPIKVALKWYALSKSRKIVPSFTVEMADQIPGLLNDRRTMLGELNWIFTAVTDTIAWNTLSRELFQKLFRQDLLVASLFRNFLLAEKVLNFYNCSPISIPRLPSTRHHFMWLVVK
ncbi:hypothetical protein HELRODRAFT_71730 [Helobdella robusta]|uniref:Raptor N-terminal CASPase-like domain-containing protein n=1 Tax=Helobdella robusta TaxID=6412 RepID=T1G0Q6_HELRO|nr:hypothetical protein HELRODRAFT_71730 [Helobdella robusta]ESO11812.1 hypothetical protein HELRODRAFT_71730 [Helobdella robusta]